MVTLEKLVQEVLSWSADVGMTAQFLIPLASDYSAERLIPLLPPEIAEELQRQCAEPPASIDDFFWVQSSNYRPSAFEGLSEEGIRRKVEADQIAAKQRILDGMVAIHRYFLLSRPGA